MPSLKEYKAKLASLNNTRKITKTMKMVAASRLNKAMDAQRKALAYSRTLKSMIGRLAASVDNSAHPLLQPRSEVKNVLLIVVTSDKGLCGGFNNNLIKAINRWMTQPERAGQTVHYAFCGRRGYLAYRSQKKTFKHYEGVTGRPRMADAVHISHEVCHAFLGGQFDEVHVAYNHFINPLAQKPTFNQLLPIFPSEVAAEGEKLNDNMILEPGESELLSLLIPKTVEFDLYFSLLENAAGENGARMTAMDNATTNANQMITLYTLLRNRARQASITKELIEIVSGAEALKG
jgi:F-type H+-transporting ATPase subunit gamma